MLEAVVEDSAGVITHYSIEPELVTVAFYTILGASIIGA